MDALLTTCDLAKCDYKLVLNRNQCKVAVTVRGPSEAQCTTFALTPYKQTSCPPACSVTVSTGGSGVCAWGSNLPNPLTNPVLVKTFMQFLTTVVTVKPLTLDSNVVS